MLAELNRILAQLEREGRRDEALRIIAERFTGQMILKSKLHLESAVGIVESMDPGVNTADLQKVIDSLCGLSMHDPLTKLFNRRYFQQQLDSELRRARRSMTPLCVLIGDIDFFKTVNDTFGHPAGDRVICAVADAFTKTLRNTDIISRIGGEEFGAILPSTSPASAVVVADRVREAAQSTRLSEKGPAIAFTVSIGVAAFVSGDEDTPTSLYERADKQLYRAKHAGRNQVCCSPEDLERMKPAGVSAEERALLFK